MLNKKEFSKIRKEIEKADKVREDIIRLSRDIISISKRIIYSIHRGNLNEASEYIKEIKIKKNKLDKINRPADANINKTAYQEYAEALCYYGFVKNKKIPTKASLKIDVEDYEELAKQYGVRRIPTILLFENGKVVDFIVGAVSREILAKKLTLFTLKRKEPL